MRSNARLTYEHGENMYNQRSKAITMRTRVPQQPARPGGPVLGAASGQV